MIENIVAQLRPFFPEVGADHLKIEQNEYDEQCYEISEEGKGTPFLFLEINQEGQLASLSVDEEYFTSAQVLSKEEILKKAIKLSEVISANKHEPLFLSSMIDVDEHWWIDYVRRDSHLGIELPNSGMSIHILKNGVIMGANIELSSFEIEAPKILISAGEAKKLFLENLILTPAIAKFDTDYIGGDEAYYLVYYAEDFVMSIGTDATLETIETFGVKRAQYEALSPSQKPSQKLYEVIGLPVVFTKISDEQTDEGRLEIWSNQSDSHTEFEESDELEIYFDEENHVSLLRSVPNEYEKSQTNKTVEEALERAIEFLQVQYKDTMERFRLLKEEHELFQYDEEGENEHLYAYQFNFQRFERGMIVDGATITIEIDSQGLMITNVYTGEGLQAELSAIAVDCTFPIKKAAEIYAHALEMELSWSKEIDEDPIIYKLTYLPEFPATVGHMRAIDAKTGRPWFIDASWIESLDE